MAMTGSCDSIRFRMRFLAALFLLPAPFLLGARLYYLQVIDHQYYLQRAREVYTTRKTTSGKRGEIYDVNGNLLVGNVPCMNIVADPSRLKNDAERRKLAFLLAHFLKGDRTEYFHALRPTRVRTDSDGKPLLNANGKPDIYESKYAMIARGVPLDAAEKIKAVEKRNRLNVLSYQGGYARVYPKGSMLANVLGFTNVENDRDVPQLGLEKQLHDQMSGSEGAIIYERSRQGTPLSYGMHQVKECQDGKNIYLTVSEPIQAILEEGIDEAYARWKPKTIYAAIADPKTGAILAISQRPGFDPNDRSTFTPEAARSRIAEDAIEPGSIAKPFSIGKALDWGFVTPNTAIDCEHGRWMYLNRPLSDSHQYDMLTVAQVIQKSSNIGTAKVALLMGKERVYQALRQFGFGTRTGLPFSSETRGRLPEPKYWDGLSITRFPIGYSIMVSPLQMLRAYCALANDGWLPQLRLIDRIENPETGEITRPAVAKPIQMFEHPEAHRQLIEMMMTVTREGGTAKAAAIPGYEVAGKTGTSRKYIMGKGYAPGKYFSSFIGFVPARDPAFVMLITMDEPVGAFYASTVAAPYFKTV
ncbi:MAG: penicillin-binding protein 2, partial [Victivallaceae bacterium]|nr:penicillin-binding protein 2 [Victivallaceae bacterium]